MSPDRPSWSLIHYKNKRMSQRDSKLENSKFNENNPQKKKLFEKKN